MKKIDEFENYLAILSTLGVQVYCPHFSSDNIDPLPAIYLCETC